VKFSEVPLDVFWVSIVKEYPVISAKAMKILLNFQQAFTCLTNIKSKGFLSRKNCGYVCQKFGQKFNICAKGENSSITLEVNFTVTLDVNFIFIFKFNFILTCYFDIYSRQD
jgi:hypothetical protein